MFSVLISGLSSVDITLDIYCSQKFKLNICNNVFLAVEPGESGDY